MFSRATCSSGKSLHAGVCVDGCASRKEEHNGGMNELCTNLFYSSSVFCLPVSVIHLALAYNGNKQSNQTKENNDKMWWCVVCVRTYVVQCVSPCYPHAKPARLASFG